MIMKEKVKDVFSILDIFISLILGIAFSILPIYYKTGSGKMDVTILGKAMTLSLIFLYLAIIIRLIILFLNNKNIKIGKLDILFDNNKKIYKYRVIIFALIILVCWLPIIGAMYPGTVSNDTWGQMAQFYNLKNGIKLNDHHPVFNTLLMGVTIVLPSRITMNWHSFMFTYVILQAIATSMAFGYSLVYAKEKLKLKNIFIIIFLVLYCLLPIFPTTVQGINKDTIFAWIYVLFFINYIEIVRTNGENLKSKKSLAITIILSIFCCLTKKVGMYVVLLSFATIFVTKISNKKRLLIPIFSVILLMMVILPEIFKVYKVRKGGEQEKYSLLFQQTARYLKYHQDDATEEIELIEEVIGKDVDEIVKVYNPKFADPVKGYSQMTATENYRKYLLVWAKQGLRHPMTYIDAASAMISGWISFREYKPLMNMDWHSQLNARVTPEWITQRKETKQSADFIQTTYDKIYNIPIIGILLTPGLYIALIPAFAFTTIIKNKNKNKKQYWVALIPLALSIILGCFLAPDSGNIEGQRYMYPITYTSLITLMWAISAFQEKDIE